MRKDLDLQRGSITKLFFQYLIPSISATLVTSVYILADTVMIGQGVGPVGIAALNIILPIFSLFYGTGMMFGVGGSVYFSVEKGKGNEREARKYFTAALEGAAGVSILYLLVFNMFFEEITGFLGNNPAMDEMVQGYGRMVTGAVPVFIFSAFLQAFVRNDKAPQTAMAAVITGGVINTVLDYFFIFPLKMGMEGAAAATVIGAAVTAAILTTHFFKKTNTLKAVKLLSLRKIREIFTAGLSSFMIELSGGIVIFFYNRQLLSYVGELGVVVYGIISNSALIVASVSNGIAQAAQPIIAVNFGAGNGERMRKVTWLGEKAAMISGLLFAAAGILWPERIIQAFIEPYPEIVSMAVLAIRIYFLSFLFTGLNLMYSTCLQSTLQSGKALFLCLLRAVILNGILVAVLPIFFGVNGIWAAMTVAELASVFVGKWLSDGKKYGKIG